MGVRDEGGENPMLEGPSTEPGPSPFARCPSAPPPSSAVARTSVRVAAPARVAAKAIDQVEEKAPGPQPFTAPPSAPALEKPHERPTRSGRRSALAAGVGALLVLAALAWKATRPTVVPSVATLTVPSAAAPAPPPAAVSVPTPPAKETAEPPPTVATAPPPEAVPSAEPASRTSFRRATARAALDAHAPELTDCRIPSGRSGKVEVVFEPDGHVSSAQPLDAYVGTFGGKCVAAHLKKARIPAFGGQATTFVYVFVIPD
jgi:hypothetical protein